jgi:DNA-binding NarL/FixJ family response regulator
MIRLLIADDHELVRAGLRTIFEAQRSCEVIAEASDGKEAIVKAVETKPDVAVIDYSMPLINGLEVTRQIRTRLPKTEVLIFTIHADEMRIHELLRAGARGYVLKTDCASHLLDAVYAIAGHKPYFSSGVAEKLLGTFLERPIDHSPLLTERETSMVKLIAEGHTNRQMASNLKLGLSTVEKERETLMRKLKLTSSAGIVRYAVRNGLVQA